MARSGGGGIFAWLFFKDLFSSSSESEDDDYFAIHDVSSSSQRVVTGEPATFSLPVYLRRDGLALRVGQVIAHNGGRFAVRNILVTSDLTTVTLNLSACSSRRSSSSGFIDEQVYVDLADVDLRAQPDIPRISRTCGRGALEHLAATSVAYPAHVQRAMRKHQLVLSMRTAVQKVLEGYEKTCELNFGPVDWRHDPKIFGLESSTAMCMEHALESYLEHCSLADILFGERWDARPVAAGNAFRVVLTMRIAVDEMQDLTCFVHAEMCDRTLDPEGYRVQFLERIKEANPVAQGDNINNETVESITHAADSSTEKRDMQLRWDSMTARKDDAAEDGAASVSENTVEEDDVEQEESLESTTEIPSVNGSTGQRITVDVGHFQKITFPTPSPTILEEEEEEGEAETVRTSSPNEFDAAAEGDGDVSRTLRLRKRVLSAIYEESPVAPAAATDLPIPIANNSAEENEMTMTPKNSEFSRLRMRENAKTPSPSPRTNDSIPPAATASSSANCSFDEAGSARTSLSSTSTRQSGRLQGLFYNAAIGRAKSAGGGGGPECPFPDDLRFGTIPEAITNDEELD